MNNILHYFLIGVLFGAFVEWSRMKAMKHPAFPESLKDDWNTTHRILTVILWPYALIMFIWGLLKPRR